MSRVYEEVRALAAAYMARERRDHTHQATSLANEAFVRMGPVGDVERRELLRMAARAMREVLVDHARRRMALKRGGAGQRVALVEDVVVDRRRPEDVVAVDEALARLEAVDPDLAETVHLRYFGGLAEAEIAEQLGVSVRTVSRRWRVARMYLLRSLAPGERAGAGGMRCAG